MQKRTVVATRDSWGSPTVCAPFYIVRASSQNSLLSNRPANRCPCVLPISIDRRCIFFLSVSSRLSKCVCRAKHIVRTKGRLAKLQLQQQRRSGVGTRAYADAISCVRASTSMFVRSLLLLVRLCVCETVIRFHVPYACTYTLTRECPARVRLCASGAAQSGTGLDGCRRALANGLSASVRACGRSACVCAYTRRCCGRAIGGRSRPAELAPRPSGGGALPLGWTSKGSSVRTPDEDKSGARAALR